MRRIVRAKKIFSPVGGNQFDQRFRVAVQSTPALVRGLGIVFSDVDLANRTTIELFAHDGTSLGKYSAPVRTDETGLSFPGIVYESAVVARARVVLGTGELGIRGPDISVGGTADLVVLDNVIYGEPQEARQAQRP